MTEEIEELRESVVEIEAIFDMRWAADMRAIKRWQAATGRDLTWPDHADLVVWLLEQLDVAEAKINAAAALSGNTKFSNVQP